MKFNKKNLNFKKEHKKKARQHRKKTGAQEVPWFSILFQQHLRFRQYETAVRVQSSRCIFIFAAEVRCVCVLAQKHKGRLKAVSGVRTKKSQRKQEHKSRIATNAASEPSQEVVMAGTSTRRNKTKKAAAKSQPPASAEPLQTVGSMQE
eukprot:jgi/Chrzof1/1260/Cz01g46200.t1